MERIIVYYSEMNIMTWGVNLEFFRRGNLIRKYTEIRVYRVHLQILVWIRLVCFWSGFPCHSSSLSNLYEIKSKDGLQDLPLTHSRRYWLSVSRSGGPRNTQGVTTCSQN